MFALENSCAEFRTILGGICKGPTSESLMHRGGAKRIILPCVGFARRPKD